jgi:hypothetical protein
MFAGGWSWPLVTAVPICSRSSPQCGVVSAAAVVVVVGLIGLTTVELTTVVVVASEAICLMLVPGRAEAEDEPRNVRAG